MARHWGWDDAVVPLAIASSTEEVEMASEPCKNMKNIRREERAGEIREHTMLLEEVCGDFWHIPNLGCGNDPVHT